MSDDLVFYVTRSVKEAKHNLLFQECYQCIRKFYTNKIVCINDKCDPSILEHFDTVNCEFIDSDYPGAGECLPYYYYLLRQDAEKVIILQDSMFVNGVLPLSDVECCKYIWYFKKDGSDGRECKDAIKITEYTKNALDKCLERAPWIGCFGSCMCLTKEFMIELDRVLDIKSLVGRIKTREDRMALERILGAACYVCGSIDEEEISICGSIFDYDMYRLGFEWGKYTFDDYKIVRPSSLVIKVWNSR